MELKGKAGEKENNEMINVKVQKVLIIRFSSIGDIILTTPVVRCLKQQLPNAQIHYLTKYGYRGIVQSNPYIDKVHVLEENLPEIISQLNAEKFDFIIDLHNNLRTLKVKRALKDVQAFSFEKLNMQKWLLTAVKVNLLPRIHIVDRYMKTVETMGVRNDGLGLDYFIPEKEIVPDDHIPHSHILGFIAIVIGAAHATKKLPLAKLQQLCAEIDHPIILLGGPEDRKLGDEIALIDDVKIYNACGKFSLNESADLVRKAKIVITHDTGLMHIAAAFKKPIISVWGNTVPAFGMIPYYGSAMVANSMFEVKGLWCRPCSKIGYNKCPLGHFKCMQKQDIQGLVTQVMSSVRKVK